MADKTIYYPEDKSVRVLKTVTDVDGKTALTEFTLWEGLGIKRCVPVGVIVLLTARTGGTAPGMYPEIKIGTNGARDNIWVQTKMVGLSTVGMIYHFNTKGQKNTGPVSGDIKGIIAVASNSTQFDMDIQLLGYLKQ